MSRSSRKIFARRLQAISKQSPNRAPSESRDIHPISDAHLLSEVSDRSLSRPGSPDSMESEHADDGTSVSSPVSSIRSFDAPLHAHRGLRRSMLADPLNRLSPLSEFPGET